MDSARTFSKTAIFEEGFALSEVLFGVLCHPQSFWVIVPQIVSKNNVTEWAFGCSYWKNWVVYSVHKKI
jgi:hypothetical protein